MKATRKLLVSLTTTASLTMRCHHALPGRHSPAHAVPYELPNWAQGHFRHPPADGRLLLANLPTPMYRIATNHVDDTSVLAPLRHLNLYVKRDDCTSGVELGGNKIRKLEFLLAQALAQGCDSLITIGGEQSNHCRATAAAARMVGLEPHLILRTTTLATVRADAVEDLGLTGNLLMDRMVGSTIYTCTPGEYGRMGSDELVARLDRQLKTQGKRPYRIPVGGSNGLGSWGYLNAVDELLQQWREGSPEPSPPMLDHIVFACGSGGTAAGICLGMALAHIGEKGPQVHAVGVCDDPDYFYAYIANIADQMGFVPPTGEPSIEAFARQHLHILQGKGLGYALSTDDELDFIRRFARETGIVLDPVYSGKALCNFVRIVEGDAERFKGSNVMFWHTGGALGLYDKSNDMYECLKSESPVRRIDIYGKGTGVDLSQPNTV